MKLIIKKDYEDISNEAFRIIKEQVISKENSVLGLATGSTPIRLYEILIEDYKKNKTSYKNIKTFNLDEYIGIEQTNSQSYMSFMKKNLFNHIDISLDNISIPKSNPVSVEEEIKLYKEKLKNNIIDIQILGIGENGHIGFNEPGTKFESTTHIANLTSGTIEANSRFFENIDDVPKTAITMGLSEIMKAKSIILLASGKTKQKAIDTLINGEISEDCPATILRNHKNVTIIVDEGAMYE